MNKDRMDGLDSPEPRKIRKEQQIFVSGNIAKPDNLVQAATVIRTETKAPIVVIMLIYPTEMKFGAAASKSIPERIIREMQGRISDTVQGYLTEPAKPEDQNDVQPP